MKFANTNRPLGILAALSVAAFSLCILIDGAPRSTAAPLGHAGRPVVLQADGLVPPPPPPPKQSQNSASLA